MVDRYFFICMLIDVSCLIYAAFVLLHVRHSTMRESERGLFHWMIVAYLAFIVIDMLLVNRDFGPLALPGLGLVTLTALKRILVSAIACLWFAYATYRIDAPWAHAKSFRVFLPIPLLSVVLLVLANLETGLMFSFGENGQVTLGPIGILSVCIDAVYLVVMALGTARLLPHEPSHYRRKDMLSVVARAVPAFLLYLIELRFSGIFIMPIGYFITIFMEFTSIQDTRIYADALTGLNNRRRTDEYLSTRVRAVDEENPVCLFFYDVDHFKQVNDQLGHIEGDWALQIVADALKQTAAPCDGFIARWGGDEFVLMADAANIPRDVLGEPNPRELAAFFDNALASHSGQQHFPEPIRVSQGWVWCGDPHADPAALVKSADQAMYRAKQKTYADIQRGGEVNGDR